MHADIYGRTSTMDRISTRFDFDRDMVMAIYLARHACGRILLHIVALARDGQIRWHYAGILREVMP